MLVGIPGVHERSVSAGAMDMMQTDPAAPQATAATSGPADTERRAGRLGRLAIAVIVLAYAVLAGMLLNTGIADNGDFSRSMQWFIEKPAPLSSNWPADEETWQRRFGNYWIDLWDLKPDLSIREMENRSSAHLLNMAGIAANRLFGGDGYSLRVASLPARAADILAFASLAVLFMRRTGSAALAALLAAGLAAVLLDLGYKAFFNSFYEDRASLLYLTILVPATVLAFGPRGRWWGKALFAVALALFSASKAQFLPTPIILLGAYALHAGAARLLARPGEREPAPRHGAVRRLGVIALLFLVPQAVALSSAASYPFGRINAYHGVFLGALVFSEEPGRHLAGFPPGAGRCIGVNAFEHGTCFEDLSPHATRAKGLGIYLREPAALWRAVSFSAASMHDIALEGYGKRHLDGTLSPAIEPTLWSSAKRLLPAGYWYLAMVAAFSLLFLLRSRSARLGSFALAGLSLTAIAASQTVVTVLGDGTAEIRKHLLVGNLAFDLALVLAVTLCVERLLLLRRRPRRPFPRP
jgi:hypothetical protein